MDAVVTWVWGYMQLISIGYLARDAFGIGDTVDDLSGLCISQPLYSSKMLTFPNATVWLLDHEYVPKILQYL